MIPSEAATIVDNCPEVENYWGTKYNEKMKKCYHFFCFLIKMITTNEYNTQKISLGSLQDKKSSCGIKYQNIPILYDGKKALVHLCGRFNLEEDVSFDGSPNYSNSLGVEVDADNRKLFEDFEKKLQSLTGYELKLIKYGRVYLKIYFNDKDEMAPKFWKVFEKDGKEYKKKIRDKESLIWKYIEGEVVFSIANIFAGSAADEKSMSIICVAKEILVKEVMKEKSYFREYPVAEDESEAEED